MKALGLMSGTSMDGIDAALLVCDGERIETFGATFFRPYTAGERAELRAALAAAVSLTGRSDRPGPLAACEAMITRAHAEAATALLEKAGLEPRQVDVVGFHGHTVLHRPERGLTVQLGDGAALARATGCDVVYDFRAADMAAGGEGAPFVPVYHRALANMRELSGPLAFVNIGGVANITWIGEGGELVAFDCGPGNALIDDLVRARTGEPFDKGGALAARGSVDRLVLARLLDHRFFRRNPPKSLDRNDFSTDAVSGLSSEDAAATLTAFTVQAIARAAALVPEPPRRWIVVGGGARNPALMTTLSGAVHGEVETAEALGLSPDFIEAQAFAYLALRSLKGLPLTYPGTTGVAAPQTGGRLVRHQRA